MSEVLFVSKAVAPPWNDSTKNIVWTLATALERYEPVVLGRRGGLPSSLARGRVEPLHPPLGTHSSWERLRVARRLLRGPRAMLWHFFFAPNPRASGSARWLSALRRVPTVQTVCSAPAPAHRAGALAFADITVVLSKHTERRFLESGVRPDRLRRIPPAIAPLEPPSEPGRAQARAALHLPMDVPLVVYPGDLEFDPGAERVLDAIRRLPSPEAHLVMACRAKTPEARRAEAHLRARAREWKLARRVTWVGETTRIHALLAAADLVVLPNASLYAKMDYPLVLLEAMSLKRAVVVSAGSAAAELAEPGGAIAARSEPEILAAVLAQWLDNEPGRRALGAAARAQVLERFSPSAMARAYEAVYDELAVS